MSDIIIRAENLGKRYLLNHQAGGVYRKFSDSLVHFAKAPLRLLRSAHSPASSSSTEEFWALNNLSFDIHQGDVVGIIGRNGAGKSTLLKILSRITEPTTGRITLRGRVASLLEVGTGFHPELTGRENIFLNGAILGMSKNEIRSKFDEIVAFAEIERFLDTPVKRYSSGMYVRLAFAVAAHLEPEILIVDEVLAVGDAQFQAKCLGKMQDVARSGSRTVLFVSHNMAAVNALCTKALLLQRGTLIASGSTEAIIDQYLAGGGSEDGAVYRGDPGVIRSGVALLEARVVKADGSTSSILECRDRFDIQISYQVHEPCRGVRVGYRLESVDGTIVCGANDGELAETRTFQPGRYEVTCALGALNLNSGSYTLTVGVDLPPYQQALFLETHCLRFSVEDTAGTGAGFGRPPGVIRPSAQWQIQDLT